MLSYDIRWAGSMVRKKDERLQKRSETKKVKHEDCRTLGRPQLRWDDCVKRDLRWQRRKKSGEKRPTTGSNVNILKVGVQQSDKCPASEGKQRGRTRFTNH